MMLSQKYLRIETKRSAKQSQLDPFVSETLSEIRIVNDSSDQPIVSDQESFKNLYHKWILSSNNFYITGLDNFTDRFVTNGVTESFNDFYYINKNVCVLKGEYTYHRDLERCRQCISSAVIHCINYKLSI